MCHVGHCAVRRSGDPWTLCGVAGRKGLQLLNPGLDDVSSHRSQQALAVRYARSDVYTWQHDDPNEAAARYRNEADNGSAMVAYRASLPHCDCATTNNSS